MVLLPKNPQAKEIYKFKIPLSKLWLNFGRNLDKGAPVYVQRISKLQQVQINECAQTSLL
jgi:hypothetical protein